MKLDIRLRHSFMMHPTGVGMLSFAPVMRFAIFSAFWLAAASGLLAEGGSPDPLFATIPFEQWLKQAGQSRIRWALHLSEPELSPHQRFAVELSVQLDRAELAKRQASGGFLAFVQLSDEQNRVWQTHKEFEAALTESFFVVPGNYRVAVAVFDAENGEYGLVQRNLHVAGLKNDPLPEMWRDLPAVEFFTTDSSRDRWYLPSVEGRLKIAVEPRRPVEVDLLVNLTPPERLAGSIRIQNRNFAALIPATKVLTEVDWRNAKFNIELLDLARRRVAYRQDNVQTLDWAKADSSLEKVNPGIIDLRSLANRRYSADFFVNRIARRIRLQSQSQQPRVLIVLSTTVFFEPGMDMHPISISSAPGVTVIYIRFQPRAQIFITPEGKPRRAFSTAVDDQLAPLLKPLAPRVFDVSTPEQFRKTLATVLEMITRL
ncbi:MAG TPA: hypothetical protein VK789_25840 [Bryobacteraceae bacterium]|nr:hypothetical protein [Bryobacteraceae bacterium]